MDSNQTTAGKGPVALLLIDVINDLDFPEADQLLEFAVPMAEKIAALKRQAKSLSVPVIYVNDNFGRWRSDLRSQVAHCSREGSRGKPIVDLLLPAKDDYFILKPRHSGFYYTPLELLLEHLGVHRLILTGIAGNICVLFTANDAYLRHFEIFVPADCTASNTSKANRYALEQMQEVLKADIRPADALAWDELRKEKAQDTSQERQSPHFH